MINDDQFKLLLEQLWCFIITQDKIKYVPWANKQEYDKGRHEAFELILKFIDASVRTAEGGKLLPEGHEERLKWIYEK